VKKGFEQPQLAGIVAIYYSCCCRTRLA